MRRSPTLEPLVGEEVGPEQIAEVVEAWTGIPTGRMLEGETAKLLRMEDVIGERLIGQADAVRAVSDAVRRSRAGISDPNRPTGSFLFLGPTGVGKTELARSLADFLFDDDRAMVRIDMSEYSEKHSVARLVGAPPGYVGYDEGGQLTEAVRRRPYSVVLLDEVEKAHPEVFDILLQVLDDGRLTDGQGHTVDFRNTLLILTSNLGSHFLVDPTLDPDKKRESVLSLVRSSFKPEFLNRLDEIVIFDALSKDDLAHIVDIQLGLLEKRLAVRRISVEVTDAARAWLAETGYDPAYGARPLRRLIQSAIGDPLARMLIGGEVVDGGRVSVDVSEADLIAHPLMSPVADAGDAGLEVGPHLVLGVPVQDDTDGVVPGRGDQVVLTDGGPVVQADPVVPVLQAFLDLVPPADDAGVERVAPQQVAQVCDLAVESLLGNVMSGLLYSWGPPVRVRGSLSGRPVSTGGPGRGGGSDCVAGWSKPSCSSFSSRVSGTFEYSWLNASRAASSVAR